MLLIKLNQEQILGSRKYFLGSQAPRLQRLTGRCLQVWAVLLSLPGRDAGIRKARAPEIRRSVAELRDASSDWLCRQMTQESDESEDAGLGGDSAMVHIPLESGLTSSFVFFCEERDCDVSPTCLEASIRR